MQGRQAAIVREGRLVEGNVEEGTLDEGNVRDGSWNHWLRTLAAHSIARFASVGVLNTLVTVATIFGLKSIFGVGDVAANLIGYLLGLALSFVLNKRWTFRHEGRHLGALLRFLLTFAASYALNLAVVLAVIEAGGNSYWAHLVGMPVYTIAFYLGCRFFAFRSQDAAPRA